MVDSLGRRRALLRAALGFLEVRWRYRPDAAGALEKWLHSWPGLGAVVTGMHAQSFDLELISRFHLLSDPGTTELATPPVLIAFDCLYARGRDLRGETLASRRKALEGEVGSDHVLPARRLVSDGLLAWDDVQERGLEGLVAKREDAPYNRRAAWLKVKVRREGVFTIVGVALADGGYSGLVLAARERGRLRYVATVEWGVGRRFAAALVEAAAAIVRSTPPACAELPRRHDVVWLEPRLSAEITYSEVMQGRLRNPVFREIVV